MWATTRWARTDSGWESTSSSEPLDFGRIAYGTKNQTSKPMRRILSLDGGDSTFAEWHYTADELFPFYLAELERLATVARYWAAGLMAPRRVPGYNWPTQETPVQFGAAPTVGTTEIVDIRRHQGLYYRFRKVDHLDEDTGEISETWVPITDGDDRPELTEVWTCEYCDHSDLCDLAMDGDGDQPTKVTIEQHRWTVTAWNLTRHRGGAFQFAAHRPPPTTGHGVRLDPPTPCPPPPDDGDSDGDALDDTDKVSLTAAVAALTTADPAHTSGLVKAFAGTSPLS